jgi:hypothetical protein
LLLNTLRQLLLRLPLSLKVKHCARGFTASWQPTNHSVDWRAIQIGQHRSARIACNGGNLIPCRSEAEPVQCQRRRFFATNDHRNSSRDESIGPLSMSNFIVAKVTSRSAKSRWNSYISFTNGDAAAASAVPCGAAIRLVSI